MGHRTKVTFCCLSSGNTAAKCDVPLDYWGIERPYMEINHCDHRPVSSSLTVGFDSSVAPRGTGLDRGSLKGNSKLAWGGLRHPVSQQQSCAVSCLGFVHSAQRRMSCGLDRLQESMSRTLE